MASYKTVLSALLLVSLSSAFIPIKPLTNNIDVFDNKTKSNSRVHSLQMDNVMDPYTVDLLSLHLANARLIKNKIIDGIMAPKLTFYYQVAIYIYSKDDTVLFCGGSVISNSFILTAAHCVNHPIASILVILGNNDLSNRDENEARRYVKKYFIHPGFNAETLQNDIALLQLGKPVTFNDAIGVINLPPSSDDGKNFINKIGIVSGFGKVQDTGTVTHQLMYLRVRVMNNYLCNHVYFDKEASSTNICSSGYGHIGACQGDSGGPFVIENKLMGIVSFGSEECTLGYPTVYTRVSAYLPWISKHSGVKIE